LRCWSFTRRASADPGLAVDRGGLRLDRAFGCLAQPGDLLHGQALDGEDGHVALGPRQGPFVKPHLHQILKGGRRRRQPRLGPAQVAEGAPDQQRPEDRAQKQTDQRPDLHHLAHRPRQRMGIDRNGGQDDVGGKEKNAKGLNGKQQQIDGHPRHQPGIPRENAVLIARLRHWGRG
jgi:hypothetical protein